jgi:hypothetical protein
MVLLVLAWEEVMQAAQCQRHSRARPLHTAGMLHAHARVGSFEAAHAGQSCSLQGSTLLFPFPLTWERASGGRSIPQLCPGH